MNKARLDLEEGRQRGLVMNYRTLRDSVTSRQFSLLPARGDDYVATLGGSELAPRGMLKVGEAIGKSVGQRMAHEPRPDKHYRIEVMRMVGQEMKLDPARSGGEMAVYQGAAKRLEVAPQEEQRLAKADEERSADRDDWFVGDRSVERSHL